MLVTCPIELNKIWVGMTSRDVTFTWSIGIFRLSIFRFFTKRALSKTILTQFNSCHMNHVTVLWQKTVLVTLQWILQWCTGVLLAKTFLGLRRYSFCLTTITKGRNKISRMNSMKIFSTKTVDERQMVKNI